MKKHIFIYIVILLVVLTLGMNILFLHNDVKRLTKSQILHLDATMSIMKWVKEIEDKMII